MPGLGDNMIPLMVEMAQEVASADDAGATEEAVSLAVTELRKTWRKMIADSD